MPGNLEIAFEWRFKIHREEASGLESSILNTRSKFNPLWEGDAECGVVIDYTNQADPKNSGLSDFYVAVKKQPGSPYPERIVSLINHDISSRFSHIVHMEYHLN